MALRFEDGFLHKLEYLRIVSARAFMGRDRADRLAQKRGRGIEFVDYRQYAPGDDVRHIDWKAYKRLNRLLLRLFDEEQDLPIYLFIDTSRSMAFDGKLEQAKRIAAALCYIGLVHFDHVTVLPFGGRLGGESVPGRGRSRIFLVFDVLDRIEASGETDLRRAFTEFASRPRQRGVAIVISDFLDPAGFEPGLKVLSSSRHDVGIVHLVSPRDREPEAVGEARFVDLESGEHRDVDLTAGLARAYRDAWDQHVDGLVKFCATYRLPYARANVQDSFEDIILRTFRQGGFVA